jgi:hypothetical protein
LTSTSAVDAADETAGPAAAAAKKNTDGPGVAERWSVLCVARVP